MVRTAKRRRAASSLLLCRLFEFPFANSGTLNLIVRTGGDSFIKTLINRPRPGIVCLPQHNLMTTYALEPTEPTIIIEGLKCAYWDLINRADLWQVFKSSSHSYNPNLIGCLIARSSLGLWISYLPTGGLKQLLPPDELNDDDQMIGDTIIGTHV